MRLAIEAGAATQDLAVELGVHGVPLGASDVVRDGGKAVRDRLAQRGLEPCQLSAFELNAIKPTPDAVRLVERAIEEAPRVGCATIVLAGGSYHDSIFGGADRRNYTDQAIDRAAETLRPLTGRAEAAGVVLSIEPYVKSAVHSAESFLQLKRRVGSGALRINLDVTNFYDLRDLIDPGPICREIIPLLAGHVGLVHIKEIRLEEGFHIHAGLAPITAGPTDWRLVLELAAQAAPPDCWVLLEHLSSREEARASVAHLRSLAADAGVSLA